MDTKNPTIPPLTFMMPGFSKCGTTSFVSMLDRHPDVHFPSHLEPWFFSRDHFEDSWDGYVGLFPASTSGAAIGDDSTSYTSARKVERIAAAIHAHYPDLALVFLVRDPVARIESSFREFHNSGPKFGQLPPFDLAGAMIELPQIVDDSCYLRSIDAYRSHYDNNQIHVVFHEDLVHDPEGTLRSTWRHLGVDPDLCPDVPLTRENSGSGKLRDTHALRYLRSNARIGPALSRHDIPVQDKYLSKVGLRRHFNSKVEWSGKAERLVVERVLPDTRRFLAEFGKPEGGWPRMEALVRRHGATL